MKGVLTVLWFAALFVCMSALASVAVFDLFPSLSQMINELSYQGKERE